MSGTVAACPNVKLNVQRDVQLHQGKWGVGNVGVFSHQRVKRVRVCVA